VECSNNPQEARKKNKTKQNKNEKQKTKSRVVDISPNILITLKVSDLNTPVKDKNCLDGLYKT